MSSDKNEPNERKPKPKTDLRILRISTAELTVVEANEPLTELENQTDEANETGETNATKN